MSTYKISEAASRAGFTASALRFYEGSGLVPDAARTPAGYRLYDDPAVERLRFVHRARTLGLPLEEIRDLVQIWDAGTCAPVQHDLAAHITSRRNRVLERVVELQALAAQLQEAELAVLQAPGDGRCGPDCACLAGPSVKPGADEDALLRRPAPVELPLLPSRLDTSPDEPLLACTLDIGQMPARLQAWRDLVHDARSQQPLPHGARLIFDTTDHPGGLAERIAELCALEQRCCSFFTFTLTLESAGVITLDVTAPSGAEQLVAALLDGAS